MTDFIVLKYGGTSIGNGERLSHVAKVVKSISADYKPIVVLSAMSGTKKSEGTTSRLLDAVKEVLKPESQCYLNIIDAIEKSHLDAAKQALSSPHEISQLQLLEGEIKCECARLRSFMSAAELIDEISPKSRDVIVSAGEKLAVRLFSYVLKCQGLPTKYISLDKMITEKFQEPLDQEFYDYLVKRMAEEILPFASTHICVVTGFFGPCPGSLLTTVGRGYTDLTAALISVGVKAKELQIWKEVDGIFTADPRKVPNARKVDYITPAEAAELTYYGSEVIHPFTMGQVIRASIPIRIKNTFAPEGTGTVISQTGSPPILQGKPTAVTIKDNITVLNISSNRNSVSHGFMARVFFVLDELGVVVDLISTSEVNVSMAIGGNVSEEILQRAITQLQKIATVEVVRDLAILSIVGRNMKNTPGVSAKLFTTLASNDINIEMISQGASEINVSCVVLQTAAIKAMTVVHESLIK